MTPTQPIRATRMRFVVAGLATLALALAACSANPAASPSASPSASPPQTIHLFDHPTSGTEVRVGSLTGCTDTTCQGDYIIGHDPLTDDSGKEVGTLTYECFVADPASSLYHCPGNTIDLTDRGQIVFAEAIQHEVGGPATTAPITGGTGEFLGTTGFVISKKVSTGGDFVITFTK
jgi:hypothetical protein